MAVRQARWLWDLISQNRIEDSFLSRIDRNHQRVTKAEAYVLITMILDGVLPTKEYIASPVLDPKPHSPPPPHLREWRYRHHWPMEMQMAWFDRLATNMGVTRDVKDTGLFGLTRGQASLFVGIWRAENDSTTGQGATAAFQQVVKDARDELPVPEGDEAQNWARREGVAFFESDE